MHLRLTQRILRERHWGEESVVFDTYSGETHHLGTLASAIFRRISASGSIELDALCAEMISHGDGGNPAEIAPEAIGEAASKLRALGLIHVEESET